MDAPDRRPEGRDPDTDLIDPIGPPVLPKASRHRARALALTGMVVGTALVFGDSTVVPTWPWPV
jgi:hypothetical protein